MPTAEDVIIMKLRWAPAKDRADIRDVMSVQGDKLDWDYLRLVRSARHAREVG